MVDSNPLHDQALEDEVRRRTKQLELECHQKTRELLHSQTELIQAEKMAALGSLVAGLAHEIRTPLGAINSNNEVIELAFRRVAELVGALQAVQGQAHDLAMKEVLAIIEDSIRTNRIACEHLVRIVHNVRNFARLDEAEWKSAGIHDGIESTLALLAHELKNRINVVKQFGVVRDIHCFPNQLNQLFMNILMNAAQSIEGEGEIRIKTWEEEDSVRIAISDSGPGISQANLARIFEPGFTTKQPGLGTGLGLSICLKIIQNHNGHIEVESRPGHGSTFLIILPVAQTGQGKTNGER